jgi:hypothetical protein
MPRFRRRRRAPEALTAAVEPMPTTASPGSRVLVRRMPWQEELWAMYRAQGEFRYGIDWLASGGSRVRLIVGRRTPDSDEPVPVTDGIGPAALAQLTGAAGGTSALMKQFFILLSVPGDSYLIGRQDDDAGPKQWGVYSADVVRNTGSGWELQTGESTWTRLAPNALVHRVYNPDPQFQWLATSPSQAVLPVLREVDLYDRKITATLVSRLASNGFLLVPQEAEFQVPPQYNDEDDPLIAQIIDLASEAIRNPGSAAAAIPFILKLAAEHIPNIRHLTFASLVDADTLAGRDKALNRLAQDMNLPVEAMQGMGKANHWSAWMINEDAIQQHIVPITETIVEGITAGIFRPTLTAMGASDEDLAQLVVWYDLSEVGQKTDLSATATEGYDRGLLSGDAWRTAAKFDEADAPTPDELHGQILSALSIAGLNAPTSYQLLTGTPVPAAPTAAPPSGGSPDDAPSLPAPQAGTGPSVPDTRTTPPPPPGTNAAVRRRGVRVGG